MGRIRDHTAVDRAIIAARTSPSSRKHANISGVPYPTTRITARTRRDQDKKGTNQRSHFGRCRYDRLGPTDNGPDHETDGAQDARHFGRSRYDPSGDAFDRSKKAEWAAHNAGYFGRYQCDDGRTAGSFGEFLYLRDRVPRRRGKHPAAAREVRPCFGKLRYMGERNTESAREPAPCATTFSANPAGHCAPLSATPGRDVNRSRAARPTIAAARRRR